LQDNGNSWPTHGRPKTARGCGDAANYSVVLLGGNPGCGPLRSSPVASSGWPFLRTRRLTVMSPADRTSTRSTAAPHAVSHAEPRRNSGLW